VHEESLRAIVFFFLFVCLLVMTNVCIERLKHFILSFRVSFFLSCAGEDEETDIMGGNSSDNNNNTTRILAIRHGETAWNAEGRFQGHLDIGLSATGEEQVQCLGRAMAAKYRGNNKSKSKNVDDAGIAAVYASDLSRALRTATVVAEHLGLEVAGTHVGLRERHFGDFQGLTYDEIHELYPKEAEKWRSHIPEWFPPGGESLQTMRTRSLMALDELAGRHIGQQIIVVVHGGVLDHLYRAANDLSYETPRTWELPNTGVNGLIWSPPGSLQVEMWGDIAHVGQEGGGDTRDESTVVRYH